MIGRPYKMLRGSTTVDYNPGQKCWIGSNFVLPRIHIGLSVKAVTLKEMTGDLSNSLCMALTELKSKVTGCIFTTFLVLECNIKSRSQVA